MVELSNEEEEVVEDYQSYTDQHPGALVPAQEEDELLEIPEDRPQGESFSLSRQSSLVRSYFSCVSCLARML